MLSFAPHAVPHEGWKETPEVRKSNNNNPSPLLLAFHFHWLLKTVFLQKPVHKRSAV